VLRTMPTSQNRDMGHPAKLLAQSRKSEQIVARNSSHMVPIDEPETIIKAIYEAVEGGRKQGMR
jgi:hypothetical protein